MSTALTLAVAAGFVWSVILFFASVFVREREQESGFGWALAGAVVFVVVFSDRFPGHPTGPREIMRIFPWAPSGNELFSSSLVVLAILFVVYLFRVAVFYQLFITDGAAPTDREHEDILNDLVAPALSYLCFAICAVTLVQAAYKTGFLVTAAISVLLITAHYGAVLSRLIRYFGDLATALRFIADQLWRAVAGFVLRLVILIARAENFRRHDTNTALSKWATARLDALDTDRQTARRIRKEKMAQAARRLEGQRKKPKRESS